jgi:hypothetical protein
MIIYYTEPSNNGKCKATVLLDSDEQLIVVRNNSYYQIGNQVM